MEENDDAFLSLAIDLASSSVSDGGGPFGAVVVSDGVVLAQGQNRVTQDNDPTAHAEVVAIRQGCLIRRDFRLAGCTIYASTEPCPMCLAAIYWARIERIVFAATRTDAAAAGFDDEALYRELPLPFAERSLPTLHRVHPRGTEPFSLWQEHGQKIPY